MLTCFARQHQCMFDDEWQSSIERVPFWYLTSGLAVPLLAAADLGIKHHSSVKTSSACSCDSGQHYKHQCRIKLSVCFIDKWCMTMWQDIPYSMCLQTTTCEPHTPTPSPVRYWDASLWPKYGWGLVHSFSPILQQGRTDRSRWFRQMSNINPNHRGSKP